MKKKLTIALSVVDVLMLPFVYLAAVILRFVRRAGVHRMPLCRKALLNVGVFPIRNHYYEPLFDARALEYPLDRPRNLPGLDLNEREQLDLLASFTTQSELENVPKTKQDDLTFYITNENFASGDAEYLYHLIRAKKPRRIVEIGSGHSTLMAVRAIKANAEEDAGYLCEHTCVEPYEMPWLEKTNVKVIRERVEKVDRKIFEQLGENDILFIDSSHMIRPQGDVLCEFLEVLPTLPKGVIVHIHDIFTPRDYPRQWIQDEVRLWNEQYLLEAFLSAGSDWKIIGALNYLKHSHFDKLQEKCIFLTADREPGSFYIQKVA